MNYFVVREIIEHNAEHLNELRVFDMNEKVSEHWGLTEYSN